MNSRGLGLVEVMISLAITGAVTMGAIATISKQYQSYQQGFTYEGLSTVRKNMISLLENDSAWVNTVNNNASMSCIKNNTGDENSVGCKSNSTAPGTAFALYDTDNNLVYDFSSSASPGLTLTGAACDGFDPVNGNPGCPIGVNLRWYALCDPASPVCHLPIIKVTAVFTYNPGTTKQTPLDSSRLNISLHRKYTYCAPQPVVFTDTTKWTATANMTLGTPSSGYISANAVGYNEAVDFAKFNTVLSACNDQGVTFSQKMAYTGTAVATDPANQASFCLASSTALTACQYEWRQTQRTWSLYVSTQATPVYTIPAGQQFDATTVFRFVVSHGLVKFYADNLLQYVFERPWLSDYVVRASPPPSDYSTGFQILP